MPGNPQEQGRELECSRSPVPRDLSLSAASISRAVSNFRICTRRFFGGAFEGSAVGRLMPELMGGTASEAQTSKPQHLTKRFRMQ
jgi:hypothetical protein